jgi:hypothetical protein
MGRHLISRDELLAAGALYVPPSWRKSLQAGLPKPKGQDRQRDLFSDLPDDDAPHPAEPPAAQAEGAAAEDDAAEDADEA